MKYSLAHIGINVLDLSRSVEFYTKAFDMHEVFRMHPKSELDMILCFLSDEGDTTEIALTWYGERDIPYELGENDVHLVLSWTTSRQATKSIRKWESSALKN